MSVSLRPKHHELYNLHFNILWLSTEIANRECSVFYHVNDMRGNLLHYMTGSKLSIKGTRCLFNQLNQPDC